MGTIPGGEGDQSGHVLESSAVTSSLAEFFREKPKHPVLDVTGARGSSRAFLLSRGMLQGLTADDRTPALLLAGTFKEAMQIRRDLEFFFAGESAENFRLCLYPSADVPPYVPSSPNVSVTSQRLQCLYSIATATNKPHEKLVVITHVRALMEKVIPPRTLLNATLRIAVADDLERDALVLHLSEVGYLKTDLVEECGTFAVRGGIVDIFSPLSDVPIRLEFIGDTVETIRRFNPENQRAYPDKDQELLEVTILPAREIFFNDLLTRQALNHMKSRMDDAGVAKDERLRLTEMVRNRIYFPGIEHYLSIFQNDLVFPTDYFTGHSRQICYDPYRIWQYFLNSRDEMLRCFRESKTERHPTSVVLPHEHYIFGPKDPEQFSEKAFQPFWIAENRRSDFPTVNFHGLEVISPERVQSVKVACKTQDTLREEMEKSRKGVGDPFRPVLDLVKSYESSGYETRIILSRKTQAKKLQEIFANHDIQGNIKIQTGELSSGFLLPGEALAFIAEEEIFGSRVHRRMEDKTIGYRTALISAFSELKPGDYVVHSDFGIGRYLGLENLEVLGAPNDFIHLEYKGGDKLYLPVHRLSRIQKYVGGESDDVGLDKLGNTEAWQKTQERVRGKIREVAKELIELYATRQLTKGHAFSRPDELYFQFASKFPYEETPDQTRSIEEVLQDMASARPMDRLICGDVGFGKTEVAIRAMFVASMEGYQTAFLAPTTVLVYQHFKNLEKRFENFPVSIGMLSRFATKSEIQGTLNGLAEGKIDIVVGTHRLLSEDVRFKNLGLLVIDEEQRFGVRHKERIKLFRKNVEVLTLSATPIPRTLNMSMIGIRDLSVINTPPLDRVSIRTMIAEFDDRVVREAVLRELQRGGQIFFVHNRVHNIQQIEEYLKKLVPEARIAVGHGQMGELELEQVMVDFVNQKFDILLCTAIIESGLDIPLVNTIIINRADQFGLSQLYQLRGRVGRSSRRAYAYLLIPNEYLISEQAQKRLEVLQRYTELGSGFKVASYDLEIRGAGNLLGKDQSGQIKAVGLELYAQLMNKAIRELKGELVQDEIDPEIDLKIPAFIPKTYLPDENLRLGLYKRLSLLDSDEEVEEMEIELQDRFGPLPRELKNLLQVIEIKILARKACIAKAVVGGATATLYFDTRTPVDVKHVLHLVNTHKGWRLLPDNRLLVNFPDNKDGSISIDREARVLKETRLLLEKLLT